MGIPGLLKEIGKGERIALSKLAIEFLERNRRPLRIAIDIAIWQYQNQAGQGGQNPALRTFYYRLLRLLALPIHPLFVYDGPNKPLAKRNRVVSRYSTTSLHNETTKRLLQLFHFPYRTAPGEAEAECALLQREGIVDAVMSQDVDALMWGSTMTLRDWSQEGTRGNKTATHVNVLRVEEIRENTRLDPDGMILVAMLSGGDYAPDGVPGFGPGLACEVAKAQFGSDLLKAMSKDDDDRTELSEWKDRLHYELETNDSGYFRTKHKSARLPADFPDKTVLHYYTHPTVSSPTELQRLGTELQTAWNGDINVMDLREHVAHTFNWQYRGGACKFIRSLAPALLAQRLLRQKETNISSSDAILERRMHFVSDGMPELRIAAIPADIVGVNIEDEEDNSEYVQAEEADFLFDPLEPEEERQELLQNTSKPRKKAPWDPRIPEKVWLPETIVKLGVPGLVEEWEQRQRDMLADPRKFIANKARKLDQPSTATQQTRSIQAYFTTTKLATSQQSAKSSFPQKTNHDPSHAHDDSHQYSSSTPTRQKTKSKVAKALPTLTSSPNPFSLASQSKTQNTDTRPKPLDSIDQSLTNARAKATTDPIRRKFRQKSKTLTSSFQEPILISSSPSSTPPPPAPPSRHRPSTPPPPAVSPHNDSLGGLPCASQLLKSHTKQTCHKRTQPKPQPRYPIPRSPNPPCRITNPRPKLNVSQIFAQYARNPNSSKPAVTITEPDEASPSTGSQKKQRLTVLSKDSLPETWREALDDDDDSQNDGVTGDMDGKRRGMLPRVSLVDLTDL